MNITQRWTKDLWFLFYREGYCVLVIHERVASCEAKCDLAIVFIWILNMIKRDLYGCQAIMWTVVALHYVHLAKLEVCLVPG